MRSIGVGYLDDVRSDTYLRLILVTSAILCGFWFWYRSPNFATPDEYSRLVQPMEAAGLVLADPGLESVRAGVLDGRTLGATFYLYGIVLVPVFALVVLSGQLGTFLGFGSITSRWTLWFAVPGWFWTAAIVLSRLVVVGFGVGCVYLTYRIGTELRGQTTGRWAALLLTLTFGFVSTAHEIAEDVPMLFLFLLSLFLVFRYLETGDGRVVTAAGVCGGSAIAFKLTAGILVFVIGGAILYSAVASDRSATGVAKQALAGAVGGAIAVYVGIPSVLVGGPEQLIVRALGASAEKAGAQTAAPIWYWFLKQYLNAFGLPLAVAVVVGSVASVDRVRREGVRSNVALLFVLGTTAMYLVAFSQWGYVRVHHLLPTYPLLVVPLAETIAVRVDGSWPPLPDGWAISGAQAVVALLVVTSALYTAAGVGFYTDDPRDRATGWLAANADDGDRVEVYENSIADVGVPHGMAINRYDYDEQTQDYNGSLGGNESEYTDWMVSMPDRAPEYIQLTTAELRYLGERGERYPTRREYVRGLLNGEYEYEVVERYGSEPPERSGVRELLFAGTVPTPEQREERVVLLRRVDDPDES